MARPGDPSGSPAAVSEDAGSIDDVLASLDRPPPRPRDLYYRWEREQWEAGAIDFAPDRSAWPALDPATRTSILAALACVLVPDGRVAELLVPFVDAVATEEEQVFLTTQLVDEARAVVLSDRFFEEVVQGKSKTEKRDEVEPGVGLANRRLDELFAQVAPRAEAVRVDRMPSAELHAGLLLLDVVFEGVVLVAVTRRLCHWLERDAGLDGLRTGLVNLGRDVTRHVLFAEHLIQNADQPEADLAALEGVIEEALPVVRGVVDDAAEASNDFAGLPLTDAELSTETMECLARRVQDVGIDLPT
ncbi:MAG TPA: hypothetical protein VG709_03480 [Actinomycetota bacterium]|nr:hypothetical protein [Actinomycetota bacterium]